ncbi:MAG: hypothetical protein KC910_10920 [Candidatus Eremiobacteraeota bacterium]|nr:hypothetical protein [Candidatus Eremiobacteraeota bacterium]
MRGNRRGGVTLLEALIALSLFFMLLSSIAFTIQQALAAARFQETRVKMGELSQVGQRLRQDAVTAITLDRPAGVTELLMTRINPEISLTDRLANPFDTTQQIQVRYREENGTLLRIVEDMAGVELVRQAMLPVKSFTVSEIDPLRVTVVMDDDRPLTFEIWRATR